MFKVGCDEIERAVKRYMSENKETEERFLKHGSTFFNSGYIDYLDCNYVEPVANTIVPRKRYQVDSS